MSKVWEILDQSYYTEEGIKEIEEQYVFLVGVTEILGIETTKKILSMFDCNFRETYKILCETTELTVQDKLNIATDAVNSLMQAGNASKL